MLHLIFFVIWTMAGMEWQAGSAARPESPGFRRGLLFDRLATTGGRVIPPWNKSPEWKRWDTGYEYRPGYLAQPVAMHHPATQAWSVLIGLSRSKAAEASREASVSRGISQSRATLLHVADRSPDRKMVEPYSDE